MVFVYKAYQPRSFKSGCNVGDYNIIWTFKAKSRLLYSN